jgi:hypothetical protein
MEILQHDPIDPNISNFDVKNWLKEKEPQVFKLVKNSITIFKSFKQLYA